MSMNLQVTLECQVIWNPYKHPTQLLSGSIGIKEPTGKLHMKFNRVPTTQKKYLTTKGSNKNDPPIVTKKTLNPKLP